MENFILAHEICKELGYQWPAFRQRALKLGWKKFGTMTRLSPEDIKVLTKPWGRIDETEVQEEPRVYAEDDPAALFDDSHHGEAGVGMMTHNAAMSQLNRMISEQGQCAGGQVYIQHPNDDLLKFEQRIDVLARRIEKYCMVTCNADESVEVASELMAYWDILYLPRNLREEYIKMIQKKGQNPEWDVWNAVKFFRELALPLAEVENIDPDDLIESGKEIALVNREGVANEYLHPLTENDNGVIPNPRVTSSHQIGIPTGKVEYDWIEGQDKRFKLVYHSMLNSKSAKDLSQVARKAYPLNFKGKQAQVIWDLHRARKANFDAQLSSDAKAVITCIRAMSESRRLLRAGKAFFHFQNGSTLLRIPKEQWANVWNAYHARKRLLEGIEQPAPENKQLNLFKEVS